ncbi:MAG: SRPBCC family protein [Myxococcota bacterium]|nr:SRPBCC family protein [Myxococcota bacterium]
MLKQVALALCVTVLAVVLGATALSDTYKVTRSCEIAASPEKVYGILVNAEQHAHWAPWRALDTGMEVQVGEVKSGVGATYSWESKSHGSGAYTIKRVTEPVRIEAEIDLGESGQMYATWKIEPVEAGVSVLFRYVGEATGILGRYFALGIDGAVGPIFEDALERLKREAERQASESTEQ